MFGDAAVPRPYDCLRSQSSDEIYAWPLEPRRRPCFYITRHGNVSAKEPLGRAIMNQGSKYGRHSSLWPVHTWLSSTRGGRNGVLAGVGVVAWCARPHPSTNTRPCHSAVQITQVAKAHGRGKIRSACMSELGTARWVSTSPGLVPSLRYSILTLRKNKVDRRS
jgi:hypothetical protein